MRLRNLNLADQGRADMEQFAQSLLNVDNDIARVVAWSNEEARQRRHWSCGGAYRHCWCLNSYCRYQCWYSYLLQVAVH